MASLTGTLSLAEEINGQLICRGAPGNGIADISLTSTSGNVDTYTITMEDGATYTFTVTNGNGIESIEKTSTSGNVDTYTITFEDATTTTFTVTNGTDGTDGTDGADGEAATITIGTVTTGAAGTSASVTNSGTSSAAVLDFVIPQGATGATGETGAAGADGEDGEDGVGISSIAKTSTSGLVDTYTITYTDGTTSTFTVTNGADGSGSSVTVDSAMSASSTNPVQNAVIYAALADKADSSDVPTASSTTPSMDGTAAVGSSSTYARADHVHPSDTSKQDALTFDSTPTSGSTNPVTSGGVYTALAGKEDTLTFDSTPTSSSTNPVTSGGVYTALADKQDAIVTDTITTTTSWSGSDPYTQTVTVASATITSNSKVDLQPDSTAIAQMVSDGCTGLYVSNTSGTLTLYAVGASLTAALTIQCTITEVS